MGFIEKIKSAMDRIFLGKLATDLTGKLNFNFRRLWITLFTLTCIVSILPLIFFAIIDEKVTHKAIEAEVVYRTSRFTSNFKHFVTFFIDERKSALDFIIRYREYEDLLDSNKLEKILDNLKYTYGGFTDIGIIGSDGIQKSYVGPYELQGKDYSNTEWFSKTMEKKRYVSDIFLGYRHVPHLVIALKKDLPDGRSYVLRATMEDMFINLLSKIEMTMKGDAFLINEQKLLQTPSKLFGNIGTELSLDLTLDKNDTRVIEEVKHGNENYIIGLADIPETPFMLVSAIPKSQLIQPWAQTGLGFIEYLIISIVIIVLWVLVMTTYVVKRLRVTDKRRLRNLHMAEHSNKMASIGRLAAGVAHEINNPLAIIYEKAGYVKDKFELTKEINLDKKLLASIDNIISSVERCSKITKKLLLFSRDSDNSITRFNLKEATEDLFHFVEKEAHHKSIDIILKVSPDLPELESDRGKYQQIMLNLINNAFEAMEVGGRIIIMIKELNNKYIEISVEDNGCGISQEDLDKIFEPFFTTKPYTRGTGLGLSITAALIKELLGSIRVKSKEGTGTVFILKFPINMSKGKQKKDENSTN